MSFSGLHRVRKDSLSFLLFGKLVVVDGSVVTALKLDGLVFRPDTPDGTVPKAVVFI